MEALYFYSDTALCHRLILGFFPQHIYLFRENDESLNMCKALSCRKTEFAELAEFNILEKLNSLKTDKSINI